MGGMAVTVISDTHERHDKLKLRGGDLLIHCGDWTWTGGHTQTLAFLNWFARQKYKHKVLVAGNHDRIMDRKLTPGAPSIPMPDGVTYLENSGTEVMGYKIWGSPYSRKFHQWAFMHNNDDEAAATWEQMPEDISILITHGPPHGIFDKVAADLGEGGTILPDGTKSVGCKLLRNMVDYIEDSALLLHCFGHVHERHGVCHIDGVTYVNASMFDHRHLPAHGPVDLRIVGGAVEILSVGGYGLGL